jgi:hypothetical protein
MYTIRGGRLYSLFPSLLRVVIRVRFSPRFPKQLLMVTVSGAVTKELLKQEALGNQIADMRLILSRRLKIQAYPDH